MKKKVYDDCWICEEKDKGMFLQCEENKRKFKPIREKVLENTTEEQFKQLTGGRLSRTMKR